MILKVWIFLARPELCRQNLNFKTIQVKFRQNFQLYRQNLELCRQHLDIIWSKITQNLTKTQNYFKIIQTNLDTIYQLIDIYIEFSQNLDIIQIEFRQNLKHKFRLIQTKFRRNFAFSELSSLPMESVCFWAHWQGEHCQQVSSRWVAAEHRAK